jgi:hypothetical protein
VVFGSFLDGLGQAFDGKTSTDLNGQVREAKKSESENEAILKVIADYKLKRAFNEYFANGSKGKFDKYVVDTFLIGKFNKGWMQRRVL